MEKTSALICLGLCTIGGAINFYYWKRQLDTIHRIQCACMRIGISKKSLLLHLVSFKEGDTHLLHCPVLDITGYGNTEKEAEDSLFVMLEELIRYTKER
jgi:hypothetical protein